MVDYKTIGMRIKEQRNHRGFTQELLAEKACLTVEYISRIENGKAKPTIDTLSEICDILNINMGNVFAEAEMASKTYKVDEISRCYQECKPEIKPLVLDIVKKLSLL